MSAHQTPAVASGRLLYLKELCEWLGLTQRQVRNLIEKNAIPVTRIDGRVRFDRIEIEKWLARSTTKPRRAA
jgi:excisionase family DNA binding protein